MGQAGGNSPQEKIDKQDDIAVGTGRDPLLGAVFDSRYEILTLLGRGATGTAYKAHDKILKRYVAIKIIHSFLLSNQAAVERFRQESVTGTLLSHPNIAGILSSGISSDGRSYMI